VFPSIPPASPASAQLIVATPTHIDDLADLEDRSALAAHFAEKAAGRSGVSLDTLDAALDRIDAETIE
jgi:hypothetical protein